MKESVLGYVRAQQLLKAGDRVGVAVSGGADSVALLRVLLELRGELGIVPVAVLHFNHRLRGHDSDEDERFVRALAERHGLEFRGAQADTAAVAQRAREGIEAAARRLRYDFFAGMLPLLPLDVVATGHTLHDQAETVLMRLLRGAGTRGLAGIFPRQVVALHQGAGHAAIVRPLLAVPRPAVLDYLQALGQDFREDASNRDFKFLRNRIRHELLPLLARDYNPRVVEALAQTAEVARAEQQHWEREVGEAARRLVRWKAVAPPGAGYLSPATSPDPRQAAERERFGSGHGLLLEVPGFLALSPAVQRHLLRDACSRMGFSPSFEQVEELRALAGKRGGTLELPAGVLVVRERDELRLWVPHGARAAGPRAAGRAAGAAYEYELPVPGEVEVRELGIRLVAAGQGTPLLVRNWRAGDRFFPPHSRGPRKVKELLTEKKVTGRERALWPVVAAGARIVWLRGWGLAADAVAASGTAGMRIQEVDSAG